MSRFITRIVLHDAEPEDYDTLYEHMALRGFSKEITASDGVSYELPPAEYYIVAEIRTDDVLQSAKAAAKETRLKFSVMVSKYSHCRWYNLKPA